MHQEDRRRQGLREVRVRGQAFHPGSGRAGARSGGQEGRGFFGRPRPPSPRGGRARCDGVATDSQPLVWRGGGDRPCGASGGGQVHSVHKRTSPISSVRGGVVGKSSDSGHPPEPSPPAAGAIGLGLWQTVPQARRTCCLTRTQAERNPRAREKQTGSAGKLLLGAVSRMSLHHANEPRPPRAGRADLRSALSAEGGVGRGDEHGRRTKGPFETTPPVTGPKAAVARAITGPAEEIKCRRQGRHRVMS